MKTEIAKTFKNLRLAQGISQEEVSKKLGIHRVSYSNFEVGQRDLTLEEAIKLYFILKGNTQEKRNFLLEQVKILDEIIKQERELPSLSKKEQDYYNKLAPNQ